MSICIWITDETPPRALFVKGRSSIDPDCLVAFIEGDDKNPLWIVDDGCASFLEPISSSKTRDCCVCGLNGDVRARRVVIA